MSAETIPILLVTANVGSIFEDPAEMLKIWTAEFLANVARLDPKFIALHCQEVGGKNYENSMKHVQDFVNLLTTSKELKVFDRIRVFLDEDYSSAENFTALGNLYFLHESVKEAEIWDFKENKFVPCAGKEIYSGNIEAVVTKEKAKFPQDFFPECKWSRKGFLRTRWSVNGTVFDLVNIHLFHDASNFVAMETYPSVYCKNRRRALEHTLQRFHNDVHGKVPYFLFGDFNFRTDTDGVIKKLTEGLTTNRIQNNKNNEYTKLQYTNEESETVLTVGKKEFNHSEHQTVFLNPSETWLKHFDKELDAFADHLTEFPVTFPPSYPFEEKIAHATSYMQTRCPAWCDRVLLSHTAQKLISAGAGVEYGLMGRSTCMGDHKPVYLKAHLTEHSGTITCCLHPPHERLPQPHCQCCRSFATVTINITDTSPPFPHHHHHLQPPQTIDAQLLHEPITRDMLAHEPYTPESADSHSPFPEIAETDTSNNRRSSVLPADLKTRLEDIIRTSSQSPIPEIKRSVSQGGQVGGDKVESGGGFRGRTMSETVKKTSRARLISSAASVTSTVRLQSHHSSSDEEWFEFDENSNSRGSVVREKEEGKKGEGDEVCAGGGGGGERGGGAKGRHTKDDGEEKKSDCCCVLM